MKLSMFRTVPLSIIRSLFTVHSAMVYVSRFVYSFRAGPGWCAIRVLLESCTLISTLSYWVVEVYLHLFLALALYGGKKTTLDSG
jgi:hypothetical protein